MCLKASVDTEPQCLFLLPEYIRGNNQWYQKLFFSEKEDEWKTDEWRNEVIWSMSDHRSVVKLGIVVFHSC